jgi:hypothetical protein
MRCHGRTRAPFGHCDQRGRSYALGVKSGLTHVRPGGDRLRSSRVNPANQFLCICPPRRDSIQEPILDGRAALTTGGPWPVLGAVLVLRSRANFSPGEGAVKGAPRKFTNPLSGRTRPPRRPMGPATRACSRQRARRRRAGMLDTPTERRRSPSEPGVAPSHASPRHTIVCPPRHTAPPVRGRFRQVATATRDEMRGDGASKRAASGSARVALWAHAVASPRPSRRPPTRSGGSVPAPIPC